ncbi:hypothetical protein BDV95DRAFT_572536 [Massariosphaeria phaeospora]|uniref:Uncharacterized protein n=1 Tax=Massariosphaeria phaeospora TaxID=100035 RepID=A0A7C8MEZ3_9PLEO|nr:hypothetical protein BDV95DRAFT_572536 [Massariosphaeria phaeospora]
MVKVLENRMVDLDIMPGSNGNQEAIAKATEAATESIPTDDAQIASAADNAQNAGLAAAGALGGTVKGLVDTTGNTVGTLGEGVAGTVMGLGKGVGNAAIYGGSALDSAGRGVGSTLGLGGGNESAGKEEAAGEEPRK